jgi:hypothetical protein
METLQVRQQWVKAVSYDRIRYIFCIYPIEDDMPWIDRVALNVRKLWGKKHGERFRRGTWQK